MLRSDAPFDDADLDLMAADCAAVLAEPHDVVVNLYASGPDQHAVQARLRKARVLHENAPSLVARLVAQLRAERVRADVATRALTNQCAALARERDLARWAMLSIQERTVLAWLWEHGPARTADAAAGLGLTRPGLCNVTKRLIASGLVRQPKHGVYEALPSTLADVRVLVPDGGAP